jgi:hypothetical protein
MIKTQIQIPDELYHTAKAIAEQREWSLAEVVRRGLEHMAVVYPVRPIKPDWQLPVLKKGDFRRGWDSLDLKALAEMDEIREMIP